MNTNENNDSSKNKKQKQGTLDQFVFTQKTTNNQEASSSAAPINSSHSKKDCNNETQETEMGTMSDSDDSTEQQSWENASQFSINFNVRFNALMRLVNYCDNNKGRRHPLFAPLLCVRYLLHHGIDINDQDIDLSNYNDVAGLLEMLSEYDDNIDEDVIKNAPLIQTDLINSCSKETTKAIVKDIGGDYFAILVDQHEDSVVLCLRYVNKEGDVVERLLGIVNVVDGTALSLKNAIYGLLEKHSLSACNIRGQGYNALGHIYAGDVNGLQTMIKNETQSAYYIHCFANHLQPTFVELTQRRISGVSWLFFVLEERLRVVIASWKENKMPKESHFQKAAQATEDSFIEIGNRSNQKVRMGRSNDETCCGPYYKLISNVVDLYPVILEMLDMIADDTSFPHQSFFNLAYDTMNSFESVFLAYLLKTVLEVTIELSSVLQKKDENIIVAMSLLKPVKGRLQMLRDDGWEPLLSSVISFCNKNDITVPNMEDMYVPPLRSKRDKLTTTNLHHFQVEVFFATIDLHLQELNSRFDEVNMELLVCMASLSPIDSFSSFDKQKLLRLAAFYPNEFSSIDLDRLGDQLDKYINDVRKDESFMGLKHVKELSKKLVEVKKHEVYNLVYLLFKLVLILPVATASVERAFSGMDFVKRELQTKEFNELLNDRLVTCVERDVLSMISNEDIINNFESMKTHQA